MSKIGLIWKDDTSYRRGEEHAKTLADVRTWSARVGYVELTVTRHIHLAPTQWRCCTRGLNIDFTAKSEDLDEAKLELVARVLAELRPIVSAATAEETVLTAKLCARHLNKPETRGGRRG